MFTADGKDMAWVLHREEFSVALICMRMACVFLQHKIKRAN